ncbi:MAG: helix-turn-helix transcriptional regulator [Phycisphaerae bacterium]
MEISGSTIKAYREHLRLSQRDLAEILGCSQGLISAVELGRAAVSRRLMRLLRTRGEEDLLSPTFAEFLEQGGIERRPEEAEFRVARPIPLEVWHARVNLKKPADAGAPDRIYVPGLPDGTRAFRFAPAPPLLAPDTVAVFRPGQLGDLVTNQVVLLQLRSGAGLPGFPSGTSRIGRAVVARRRRAAVCQIEAAEQNTPVVEVADDHVDVLMVCCFRGRHCR